MSKSVSRSSKGFGKVGFRQARKLRVFALEPILTPSGLVDTVDDAPDPGAIEIPDYVEDRWQQPEPDQAALPDSTEQDLETDLGSDDSAWMTGATDSDADWEELPFIT